MNIFEQMIKVMQTEMPEPSLFGGAHIFWLVLTVIGIITISLTCKNISDKKYRIIVGIFGISLLVLEAFKQFNFSYDSTTDTWEYAWKQFPFQFCSVPMYVMTIVALLKENKFRKYLCAFLATFGLFAGLVVMIYPATILSSIIFRFSQSMIHHASMLLVGVLTMVAGKSEVKQKTILKAIPVFVVCLCLAFSMNIIFHYSGNDASFNMFYIGPFSKCDIPVLSTIGELLKIESDVLHFGNFVFIFIYALGFSLAAYITLLISIGTKALYNKISNK